MRPGQSLSWLAAFAAVTPTLAGNLLYSVVYKEDAEKVPGNWNGDGSKYFQGDADGPDDSIPELDCLWGTGTTPGPQRRSDFKDVTLKQKLELWWRSEDIGVEAVLNADWSVEDDVRVMNMEDYSDIIKSVECGSENIKIKFVDSTHFRGAKEEWSWLKEGSTSSDKARAIVLFANHELCGGTRTRHPYIVTGIKFTDDRHNIDLTVIEAEDYNDVIFDGDFEFAADEDDDLGPQRWDDGADLEIADTNVPFDNRFDRRAEVSIPFNQNFDGRQIFKVQFRDERCSGQLDLTCKDCGVRGKIKLVGGIKFGGFLGIVPKEGFAEFRAEGVQAEMILLLAMQAQCSDSRAVPFKGIKKDFKIGKAFKADLSVGFGAGYKVDLDATGELTFGATGRMTDGKFKTCLFGCKSSKSGWSWEFQKHDPEFTGKVEVNADAFLYIDIGAGIQILGRKFGGGVAALAPKLEADVTLEVNSNGGACGHPNFVSAIDLQMHIGVDIFAYTGGDFLDPDNEFPIFVFRKNFLGFCFPLSDFDGDLSPAAQAGVQACTPGKNSLLEMVPQNSKFRNDIVAACKSFDMARAASKCLEFELERIAAHRSIGGTVQTYNTALGFCSALQLAAGGDPDVPSPPKIAEQPKAIAAAAEVVEFIKQIDNKIFDLVPSLQKPVRDGVAFRAAHKQFGISWGECVHTFGYVYKRFTESYTSLFQPSNGNKLKRFRRVIADLPAKCDKLSLAAKADGLGIQRVDAVSACIQTMRTMTNSGQSSAEVASMDAMVVECTANIHHPVDAYRTATDRCRFVAQPELIDKVKRENRPEAPEVWDVFQYCDAMIDYTDGRNPALRAKETCEDLKFLLENSFNKEGPNRDTTSACAAEDYRTAADACVGVESFAGGAVAKLRDYLIEGRCKRLRDIVGGNGNNLTLEPLEE